MEEHIHKCQIMSNTIKHTLAFYQYVMTFKAFAIRPAGLSRDPNGIGWKDSLLISKWSHEGAI